jgi:hypothetical protein
MATADFPTIVQPLAHLKWREQELLAQRDTLTTKKEIALIDARLAEIRYAAMLVELSNFKLA